MTHSWKQHLVPLLVWPKAWSSDSAIGKEVGPLKARKRRSDEGNEEAISTGIVLYEVQPLVSSKWTQLESLEPS